MYFAEEKLVEVFKKVRVLREQLQQHAPGRPTPVLSIMDLHWMIQEVYGLKIEMTEVSFAGAHLKGHILRFEPNRATILVRSSLSEHEKRLTAVKELCHLVIDETDDWSTDGCGTVQGLLAETAKVLEDGKGLTDPTVQLQSEVLAMLAASELIYPREYHPSDIERLEAQKTTMSAIALQHEVPAYVIQQALSNRSELEPVWAIVDALDKPEAQAAE